MRFGEIWSSFLGSMKIEGIGGAIMIWRNFKIWLGIMMEIS